MTLHHHQNNNGDRCTFVTSVVSTLTVFTTGVQSVSVTITPKYDTYATTYGNLDGSNI